jgi:hypothetical protein
MRREGTLRIVWINRREKGEPRYNIGFSDYASRQAAAIHKEIVGEQALKDYLIDRVKVHSDSVHVALKSLETEGDTSIFHTTLTDEELVALDLQ